MTKITTPDGNARCIVFHPDGHLLYADNSGNIYKHNIGIGENVGSSEVVVPAGNAFAFTLSTDGKWIASIGSGNVISVWNATTYQVALQILKHWSRVRAVDISNDSKRIASGSEDRTARIFDIITGARVITLFHRRAVVGVQFSPNGNRIATATKHGSIGVFDVLSTNKLFKVPVDADLVLPMAPLAWSSDNLKVFVGSSRTITCFDTSTSLSLKWFTYTRDNKTQRNVSIICHGGFIVCSSGHFVSFFDSTSQERIGPVINHEDQINCIAVSRNGRFLACGCGETIVVHDLGDILPWSCLQEPPVSLIPLIQVSDEVLTSWMLRNAVDTESILSEEIVRSSDPSHYALAARSLIRARLKEWKSALEDAEMSLQVKQSPIGQIAKSLALVGAGRQEDALDKFDFVFLDRASRNDNLLLLVIKSIFLFLYGKHTQAITRLRALIDAADPKTKNRYILVLEKMYLEQGDFENAAHALELAEISPTTSKVPNPLLTISLIFGWHFDTHKTTVWQRLCQHLYSTKSITKLGEKLAEMVIPLAEGEREAAHGRILSEIVTRTGQVTLLEWAGKSSKCNSCLPSSPIVYAQGRPALPTLDEAEVTKRAEELRAVFPPVDALMTYGRLTCVQPVFFAHFRLLLPCIVCYVQSVARVQESVYRAQTSGFGDVEFTTTEELPMREPRRLVFADMRIHGLLEPHSWDHKFDVDSDLDDNATGHGHGPLIEEVPSSALSQVDSYVRALELIAHLERPFSPILLLRQSDRTYRRVAADHEIIVPGMGTEFLKDVRVEVLEIR